VNKKLLIVFGLLAVVAISLAGYAGVATGASPTPTPAPDTVAVTRCDVEQSVAAPGALDNTSETRMLMPVDGNLSEVLVRAGDSVSAGQVLARLDDTLKAEAQIALKDAQEVYEKAFNYRISLNGKIWIERKKGDWYKGYASPGTIEDADNDLALKKAQLDAAQTTLDHMELKAPFNGVVIEMDAVANQPFHADDILFKIIDPKALEIVANVTEEDYPLLSVGQGAEIFFDARPDVTVRGKVSRIIPVRIEGDSPLYNIYITLDEVPDGLADGMTADTAITIAKRDGVLCLPRAIVRASGSDTTFVKVWDDVQEVEKEIKVGLRGDTYVEIVTGLNEGEQVVTR